MKACVSLFPNIPIPKSSERVCGWILKDRALLGEGRLQKVAEDRCGGCLAAHPADQ